MPRVWSDKDERQYEHIKDSSLERGVNEDKAEEIAARTVNKHRRVEGRTPNVRSQGTGNPNRALEQRWLAEHREEYLGEWVALQGDRLIAHGHDSREVYRAARSAGIGVPFVIRVETYEEPSMGGWQ